VHPAGEHLDVPRLVGALHREELHHLAKVGMHPREEARGHQQRRSLVLHEVGHHLHHGVFDRVVVGHRGGPGDLRRRIPLRRSGLCVHPGNVRGPQRVAVAQPEVEGRHPRFDLRAAGGEAPARVGVGGEGALPGGVGVARANGTHPARARAVADFHGERSVVVHHQGVAAGAAPRAQVRGERGVGPAHGDPVPRRARVEGAGEQHGGALVEAEVVEVDEDVFARAHGLRACAG
jgi:hypothetical protein